VSKATKEPAPNKPFLTRVWNYIITMKFAIIVLVVIAVTSLLSMFIVEFYPMRTDFSGWTEFYQNQYKMSDGAFALFKIFKLYDPYRSWWYQALLGILGVSLFACMWDRITGTVRLAFSPQFRTTADSIAIMPHHGHWRGSFNENSFVHSLKRHFRVFKHDVGSDKAFYGSRGWMHLFGPPAFHVGLLALVIGGLWVSLFGTTSTISGYAGDVVEISGANFKVRIDDFKIEYYPLDEGQIVLVSNTYLGRITAKLSDSLFTVAHMVHGGSWTTDTVAASALNNHFDLERDRGNIKDYICKLTIVEGGQEASSTTMLGSQDKLTANVEVNHPLRYKGYRFYQTSYDPENPKVTTTYDSLALEVKRVSDGAILDTIWVKPDQRAPILGMNMGVSVVGFYPDFRIMDTGPTSISANMNNPAVKLQFFEGDSSTFYQFSFLGKQFHQSGGELPVSLQFVEVRHPHSEQLIRTILQVKRSPGTNVIWAGFGLATLGLILAFYTGFYRVWALVVPKEEGKSDFYLAVSSRRGGGDPERRFRRVLAELKEVTK
jgi:cytochrome c biogenesis protein ResB